MERIHNTEDLGYSTVEKAEAMGGEKAMIDRDTLNRLIDECREEEERRNVINDACTNRT